MKLHGLEAWDQGHSLQVEGEFEDAAVLHTEQTVQDKIIPLTIRFDEAEGEEYLSLRYQFVDTAYGETLQTSTKAKILPAKLVVSADNKTIPYGSQIPNYTGKISGFVNKETTTVIVGALMLDGAYTTFDSVGDYSIVPSGYGVENSINGNYQVTYKNGTLKVEQTEFPTITPSWNTDATKVGTIKWQNTSKIGNVEVEAYEICL